MKIKMYRIVGDERLETEMPANSVERARQKGWIECETAQRLEMPAEIMAIIEQNKKVEPSTAPLPAPEPTLLENAPLPAPEPTLLENAPLPAPEPMPYIEPKVNAKPLTMPKAAQKRGGKNDRKKS